MVIDMTHSNKTLQWLLLLPAISAFILSAMLAHAADSHSQNRTDGESIITIMVIKGKAVNVYSNKKNDVLDITKKVLQTTKPDGVLSKSDIATLAKQYGLTDVNQLNFKVAMNEGDFSFLHNQNWPAWRLIVELAAKKIVLDAANAAKVTIPTKGDWSAYAEQVMDTLPIDKIRQGKL